MKFQTLALAAALAFGGAAIAAPNDTGTSPARTKLSHSVKVKHHATKHAVRHHAKAVRHAARKQHHKAVKVSRHHQMHDRAASIPTDVNSGSRETRMDEALRKFRTSHS